MNIELYISKNYDVIFAVDGTIEEKIQAIELNKETRLVSLLFENEGNAIELNCPVDEQILSAIHQEKFCALGFFNKGTLLEAQYLPLHIA